MIWCASDLFDLVKLEEMLKLLRCEHVAHYQKSTVLASHRKRTVDGALASHRKRTVDGARVLCLSKWYFHLDDLWLLGIGIDNN